MRTTIEIKPDHRARVLKLAAQRGEKGFSAVVSEALERYFKAESAQVEAIGLALELKGCMSGKAAALSSKTRKIRSNWR